MIPDFKTCTKCKIEKPNSAFGIAKRKYKENTCIYLRSRCKCCDVIFTKDYYKKNKEKVSSYRKINYLSNKEKIKSYNTKSREKNGTKWLNNRRSKYKDVDFIEKKRLSDINYQANNRNKINNYLYEKHVVNLSDAYIIKQIKQNTNFTKHDVKSNPDLIRLTRNIILIKRKIKNEQSNEFSAIS